MTNTNESMREGDRAALLIIIMYAVLTITAAIVGSIVLG